MLWEACWVEGLATIKLSELYWDSTCWNYGIFYSSFLLHITFCFIVHHKNYAQKISFSTIKKYVNSVQKWPCSGLSGWQLYIMCQLSKSQTVGLWMRLRNISLWVLSVKRYCHRSLFGAMFSVLSFKKIFIFYFQIKYPLVCLLINKYLLKPINSLSKELQLAVAYFYVIQLDKYTRFFYLFLIGCQLKVEVFIKYRYLYF